jgi:hypothetical protein
VNKGRIYRIIYTIWDDNYASEMEFVVEMLVDKNIKKILGAMKPN